jgi:hypothetical protein
MRKNYYRIKMGREKESQEMDKNNIKRSCKEEEMVK